MSTSHETPREDGETDTDVLVVGAGPTGLMLAFELALAGARTIVVEKAEQPNPQSRAGGIQPRTASSAG
ncbi:FAD-dependent oxidoreductase [Pseudonocardia sp. Cha107L01]|uniref:FAD-dependent oxidoreductase n=1 Tax=Pseudonocardia sp. Cha107L01 TaxID=3457576 RepID=UPI00403E472A